MLFGMEPTRLTPSQCAELIGVSTRTLRRYSSILALALSAAASQRGKKRYYSSNDVDSLRRAQKMMGRGMTLADIADVLPIQPATDEASTALTLSPEANLALGSVIERARQIGDELIDQDDRLRRIEKWAALPWWQKIFSKPEGE